MDAIETIEHFGLTIEIHHDQFAGNPRVEWDAFGSLTQLNDRYTSPGGQPNDQDQRIVEAWQRGDCELVERYARAFLGALATDWWDDPRGGSRIFGYVSREHMVSAGFKEEGDFAISPERAKELLDGVLTEYVAWAEGEVFGFVISGEVGGETADESYGGYYGMDYCLTEAKEIAENTAKHFLTLEREAIERAEINPLDGAA